ncbi:TetR/AcrR family transcriptional regulator [Saccharothrix coeruleofusca]|uniref:TetR family transcriptional regulator n=1 Tax=Saccharothrix coeruleofusca TaxID=33919 RepID=A0A918EGM5_9PSEU|nr:TetR/AcrR family transcriptional regulator [Saccharothrix coeruleofusca]MBP2336862.1 AcrR family transcriptional regulator [Saccharothrix coeruleofusca]GGP82234.1 TetR family transcriptional regulator [Saccharothrix coeruleofusca]
METTLGLRERKKAATRQALHEAALRLALEHGLERVTVEAIADAASVSRRTFSNYFANKEEAILHRDQQRLRRLLRLVRERPEGEPPRTALSRAALQVVEDGYDPVWLAHRDLLRGHPSLLAHQVAAYGAVERDLAAELARRLADDPAAALRARVLAATFLASLRAAIQHWVEHPELVLADVVEAALRYGVRG